MGCEATSEAGRRERKVDGLAVVLLAATALGGANLYGLVSGRGGLAAPSDWTNLAGGLLLAMTPLFVGRRNGPPSSCRRRWDQASTRDAEFR